MYWDRHNDADKAAMKSVLMPLVAASRCRDFADVGSARVQVLAFLQALEDVPRAIVSEAAAVLVRQGVTWMPKPGELKVECAKLMATRRTEAAQKHLEDCDHSGHFIDDGSGRMERCPCWRRAVEAMNEIGRAIERPQLPAAEFSE